MKLKLLAHGVKSHKPSAKRRDGPKSKFVFILLAIGVGFCIFSILLYYFQSMLPRFSMDSSNVITPNSVVRQDVTYKEALIKQGIVFESLTYATESPTLIVKLPNGAYAYFNATEDPTSSVKLLGSILGRLSIEDKTKKLKYVDLRFDKAVVKF